VSDLSEAIAEKSRVKELALIDGTGAELEPELGLLAELDGPLLPQAAMARATPATIDVSTIFLLSTTNETTLVRERACMSLDGCQTTHPKAAAITRSGEHYGCSDKQIR
jgi:hypothetical protein